MCSEQSWVHIKATVLHLCFVHLVVIYNQHFPVVGVCTGTVLYGYGFAQVRSCTGMVLHGYGFVRVCFCTGTVLHICTGTVLYGHSFVRARFCTAGTVLYGYGFVRIRFCTGTVSYGHGFVRVRFCTGTALYGYGFVRVRCCTGAVLYGYRFVRVRFCMGTVLYGYGCYRYGFVRVYRVVRVRFCRVWFYTCCVKCGLRASCLRACVWHMCLCIYYPNLISGTCFLITVYMQAILWLPSVISFEYSKKVQPYKTVRNRTPWTTVHLPYPYENRTKPYAGINGPT